MAMAARHRLAVAIAAVLMLSAASRCVVARDFYVGGRGGWTDKPAEPFNSWAERNRFQINDRLVFRYGRAEDSVLVVTQSHYDACNTIGPLRRLEGGDTAFVLDRSGPFFFISGDAHRCQAGERLVVVVLAERSRDSAPSPPSTPPPPPSPSPPAPPASPTAPSPAPHSLPPPPPAAGNTTSSPSPSPALAPAPAPETNGTDMNSPPPPSPSSASVLRGGALLSLVIGLGATILV